MNNFTLTVLLPIIIFWLVLFGLGFPPPMIDDLFTIGPAINLAKNGEFVNPWLADWSERAIDHYFFQPPIHGHSLGIWLSLFGVSTTSILLFQCTFYILFSVCAVLILKKYNFSRISMWAVPVIYTTFMSIVGLRQDAVGMGYLAIGLCFLTENKSWRYFTGFCFLGLAWLSSPITISYILPFSFGIVIHNYLQSRSKLLQNGNIEVRGLIPPNPPYQGGERIDVPFNQQDLGERIEVPLIKEDLGESFSQSKYLLQNYIKKVSITWISAVIVIFILFSFAVDFEIARFFQDLLWNASLRVVSPTQVLPLLSFMIFHGYTGIFYGALYFLLLSSLILFFLYFQKTKHTLKYFVLLTSIGLILNLFLYTSSLRYFLNFFITFLATILVCELPLKRINIYLFRSFAILMILIYQTPALLAVFGSSLHPQTKYQDIKTYIQKNPEQKYLIDDVAARFVFDYNLPKNSRDWYFSQTPAIPYPYSLEQKEPDTVWIISKAKGAVTEGLPDYPKVELLGRKFNSIPREPYDVMMIE